jgi:hypothetical protein
MSVTNGDPDDDAPSKTSQNLKSFLCGTETNNMTDEICHD